MSEEGQDDASKTEEPSSKRLEEAHKKGQTPATRELNHFCMLLALTFFIVVLSPGVATKTMNLLSPLITQPDMVEMGAPGVMAMFRHVVFGASLILLFPLIVTFVAAIAPAVIQGKLVISGESMSPKFSKISPFAGFKRIFGVKSLVDFLKNLVKISVVGVASVMAIMPYQSSFPSLMSTSKVEMLAFTKLLATKMLIAALIIVFFLAIVDYFWQRIMFMKQMRMSKQEVKDEYKQQEGDPHVKGRLRQIRRDRSRKRMMANVPKADVIVTNPTHYAIALQYDALTMPAPKVLAKGVDAVAGRIREMAAKHKIPIVRNPVLARVLYDTTDIEEEVPVEHYQAVAKIIGYVYRLKGKMPEKPPTAKGAAKKAAPPTLKLKK